MKATGRAGRAACAGRGGRGAFALLIALVAAFALALPATAFAESMQGSSDWTVTFGSDAKMTDNYSAQQWADDIHELQPGDDITFNVTLKHDNKVACDWYMSNEVLKTLEEGYAAGSAYGYKLSYIDPDGKTRVLYDSSTVGGDSTDGLLDATNALDDWLYLDQLAKDETAKVTLLVTLDGETEGNAYFDTLAQLKMKFAVEYDASSSDSSTPPKNSSSSSSSTPSNRSNDANRNAVQTGDDTQLFPFYVAMITSGILLLMLGACTVITRRRERERTARRGSHAS